MISLVRCGEELVMEEFQSVVTFSGVFLLRGMQFLDH